MTHGSLQRSREYESGNSTLMGKETNVVNGIQPSAKKMPLTVQLVATYPTYHQRGNGILSIGPESQLD